MNYSVAFSNTADITCNHTTMGLVANLMKANLSILLCFNATLTYFHHLRLECPITGDHCMSHAFEMFNS